MSSVVEFNNDPYDYDENNNNYYPCPFVNTPKFDKENIQFLQILLYGTLLYGWIRFLSS